jgi:alkylation response protein AidB-like acyl-CoA dehydrogenase
VTGRLESVGAACVSGIHSKTTQIYEGANQVQRLVMARQLLK